MYIFRNGVCERDRVCIGQSRKKFFMYIHGDANMRVMSRMIDMLNMHFWSQFWTQEASVKSVYGYDAHSVDEMDAIWNIRMLQRVMETMWLIKWNKESYNVWDNWQNQCNIIFYKCTESTHSKVDASQIGYFMCLVRRRLSCWQTG